eukprot:TCONS_00047639-protein
MDLFFEPFFIMRHEEEDSELGQLQKLAADKQRLRTKTIGELLRAKGFLWIATSHDLLGGFQQAGNVIRVEAEGPWMCDIRDLWEGTKAEDLVIKDMTQENGEEYQYGDHRQELVFIGMNLNHTVIQNLLDMCLLDDEEMKLGPDGWLKTMESDDRIKLTLDFDDGNDEDYEDEDSVNGNEER